MTKYLLLVLLFIASSCSRKTVGYDQFFKDYREDATLALGVPKWATLPFINREDRKAVKELAKGMKSIRLLYDEKLAIHDKFKEYVNDPVYAHHLYIKDTGDEIDMYTRTENGDLREIVLSVLSEDGVALIAIRGKVDHDQFMSRIKPYLQKAL